MDLLVRDVPQLVMEALKRRAARHRRSVQQEALTILESAAREPGGLSAAEVAAAIQAKLAESGRAFGDSAALLREDRER